MHKVKNTDTAMHTCVIIVKAHRFSSTSTTQTFHYARAAVHTAKNTLHEVLNGEKNTTQNHMAMCIDPEAPTAISGKSIQNITMHHPISTCRASSARSVSTPAAAAMTAGEGPC